MNDNKKLVPIILSILLAFAAIAIFFFLRSPNLNLWIPIILYVLIDIGFIIFLIIISFSRNKRIKWVGISLNSFFIFVLSILIYLLLLANAISQATTLFILK